MALRRCRSCQNAIENRTIAIHLLPTNRLGRHWGSTSMTRQHPRPALLATLFRGEAVKHQIAWGSPTRACELRDWTGRDTHITRSSTLLLHSTRALYGRVTCHRYSQEANTSGKPDNSAPSFTAAERFQSSSLASAIGAPRQVPRNRTSRQGLPVGAKFSIGVGCRACPLSIKARMCQIT
jgi:hypothetical protein